jgi:hypothetical protein
MKRLCAALGAPALLLGMTLPAIADGLGPDSYNFLNPPSYLKSTNQQPATGDDTVKLLPTGSESKAVETGDAQASLQLQTGSVPPSPGQTAVRVRIKAVGNYPKPPAIFSGFKKLAIQGNVYQFTVTYVPSGKPITRLAKPAQMTLLFPNTPDVLLGTNGGAWHQLCSLKNLDRAANSLTCAVTSIPAKVIMLRRSNLSNTVTTSNLIIFILGAGSIGVAILVMIWVAYRNFVRRSKPATPSGRPPPSAPPPPMNRAERRRRGQR